MLHLISWLMDAFQDSTSDLVVSVSARQSAVDQQMARLGQVIVGLHENAQALYEAQLLQESTQTRLHTTMQAGFNASLSRLFMIETSAAKLQGALQEASQSIAQITSLSWVMGTLWKWGSLAVILSLVASAVLTGHTNFARYIAGTIGRPSNPDLFTLLMKPQVTLVIIKCTVALLLEGTYRSYPFPAHPPVAQMTTFSFVIGMLVAIGWFYSKQGRAWLVRPSSTKELSMGHIGRTSSERTIHSTWRI